jgi:hypothetical protein
MLDFPDQKYLDEFADMVRQKMTLDDLYEAIDWSFVDAESEEGLEGIGENLKKEILDPERKKAFRCTCLHNLLYNKSEEARHEAFAVLGPKVYEQVERICQDWGIWPKGT